MTDFKKTLIALLERSLPELRDKVQAGAVDAGTQTPFAAFTTPDEVPIRTKDGIVGYDTLFEVAAYDGKYASTERLKRSIIAALEGAELGGRCCRLKSASTEFFPDYNLHGVTLTFRIV